VIRYAIVEELVGLLKTRWLIVALQIIFFFCHLQLISHVNSLRD
jgi:hypothetical protein